MMKNGTVWLDDLGNTIQAHGGGFLEHEGVWYWYGENKDAENLPGQHQTPFIGFSCYSTRDFKSWHYEGLALTSDRENEESEIYWNRVGERPKVLYNEKTGKFVMWFHLDKKDYSYARCGVAVSDTPTGPFTFVAARHVNRRDSRDMTLFRDEDGTAYVVHSADWNKTLCISRLTEDFLDVDGFYAQVLINQEREAPALIYEKGMYYMVTSGCTGWAPNSALYSECEYLLSPTWKLIDNPCTGPGYRQTFGAQSTFMFRTEKGIFILFDHWKPKDLKNSGYTILPVLFKDGIMEIPWQEECPEIL